uniref:Uncharacterized protein n=1 Tax=Anguilla anguilla TaxID=7936 RepID=A0A0E9X644_ANGAN
MFWEQFRRCSAREYLEKPCVFLATQISLCFQMFFALKISSPDANAFRQTMLLVML